MPTYAGLNEMSLGMIQSIYLRAIGLNYRFMSCLDAIVCIMYDSFLSNLEIQDTLYHHCKMPPKMYI